MDTTPPPPLDVVVLTAVITDAAGDPVVDIALTQHPSDHGARYSVNPADELPGLMRGPHVEGLDEAVAVGQRIGARVVQQRADRAAAAAATQAALADLFPGGRS